MATVRPPLSLLVVLLIPGILLLAVVPAPAAGISHTFSATDLVMLQRVGPPVPSPDGSLIVFPLRSTDMAQNRGLTSLWTVRPDGTGLRQLTFQPGDDSDPCWSPDGTAVYYLSTRSGTTQVWKVPAAVGTPVQVTDLPLDVSSLKIAPDGKSLAFSLPVYPGTSWEATAKRLAAPETGNASGVLYDTLPARHWDTWSDGRRNHIFVMPLPAGRPVDVMLGMDADSPSKPFGGAEEFTFTPDSRGIVFSAADTGREEMWSTEHSLYLAPVTGQGRPVNLTTGNRAWITAPSFSPDGSTLAYFAMTRPGYEADRYRIMIRTWPDGTPREVAPAWDRSPSAITWSPDSRTLYATTMDLGAEALVAIDPVTGEVRTLFRDGTVSSVSALPDGRLVFARSNFTSPADLYTIGPGGKTSTRITQVNRDRMDGVELGTYEQFSFAGWNNETVYGYVVRPAGFDPARKYPVALLVHGGPQDSWVDEFHYRWNPQVYAARGYAVVLIDVHGSIGYGQAFTDSIRGDWGGKPLTDLQKGLDAALLRYPWMDGDRVSALGASYGGYMVNWMAGVWPDRFRCLVNHNGEFDSRSEYYSTDELWFDEWERRGTPWENPAGYSLHNPADHVAAWRTPMLVVQCGRDYRVPEGNGLSTFTALQRRGVPSELLYFPDESHWVTRPENSLLWHRTVLDWLDRWNTVPANAVAAAPVQLPAVFQRDAVSLP